MRVKYKYGLISVVLIVITIYLASCKKFVQIDPPQTKLVTASVFDNAASATAAQTVIYAQMVHNSESSSMAVNTGLLSDELQNYTTILNYVQMYTNSLTAVQGPGPWTNAYNYIYQANAVLAALQNNTAISPLINQQLSGEAKFIRAFWNFYLTSLYGDIPLVLTTDYTVNAGISRTAKAVVFQQIISDLKDAQNLLSPNFLDATDTTITTERTRPTKWAATVLLARAYLYTNDYSDAEAQATVVINNAEFSLCPNLNNVFLANSTETIWQLAIPLPTSYNTNDAYAFILISAPGNSGNCCALSPKLLSSFEPGDNRRKSWVDSFKTATVPASVYYYPYKYKVRTGSQVTEYQMMLRLAEVYLIRAESRAQQGKTADAISDLNVIRNRAALANYTGPTDNNSLVNVILHERQVELFTEWGHRWLDLIRTHTVDSVMTFVTPQKHGVWSSDGHQALFPIPQSERTVDVNLTQNIGY